MNTKKPQKATPPTQPNRLVSNANLKSSSEQPITEVVKPKNLKEKPVTSYKILTEKNSHQNLQDEVERHLKEGWSLQGGVAVAMYSSPYETVTIFSQSLTKNI